MQIVIDIPEGIYMHLLERYKYQNIDDIGLSELDKVGVSIKNGIPLPKGHGNLIFREDAEAIFKNARKSLYELSRKESIKDFQTRETMLLNAEQIVHLIEPIIEADKESEDKE